MRTRDAAFFAAVSPFMSAFAAKRVASLTLRHAYAPRPRSTAGRAEVLLLRAAETAGCRCAAYQKVSDYVQRPRQHAGENRIPDAPGMLGREAERHTAGRTRCRRRSRRGGDVEGGTTMPLLTEEAASRI